MRFCSRNQSKATIIWLQGKPISKFLNIILVIYRQIRWTKLRRKVNYLTISNKLLSFFTIHAGPLLQHRTNGRWSIKNYIVKSSLRRKWKSGILWKNSYRRKTQSGDLFLLQYEWAQNWDVQNMTAYVLSSANNLLNRSSKQLLEKKMMK